MRMLATLGLAMALSTGAAAQGLKDDSRPNSWTGFYLGGHAGYAWGQVDVMDTTGSVTPGPFSYRPTGALGGFTGGYNLQAGPLLIGLEGDLGYMQMEGKGFIPSSTPGHHQDLTLDGGLYATATGRVGLVWDRTLFYGKGGWGYFGGEAGQTTTKPGFITVKTGAFTGWVYGGGIEHFVSPHVSIKAEYLRFNFGKELGNQTSVSDDPIGYKYVNEHDVTVDTIKLGIAVHF